MEGSLGVPKTFTKKQKSILWNTAKNKKGEREEKNQAWEMREGEKIVWEKKTFLPNTKQNEFFKVAIVKNVWLMLGE